jgi:hypothetical protein
MRKTALAMFASLLLPVAAQASPDSCKFGGANDKATYVDIASIYKAADLVVTGQVTGMDGGGSDLIFAVDKTIKGESAKEIILHGQQRINTEVNGFVLPGMRPTLLFLKKGDGKVFENVEGYNTACNIVYFIKDGNVVLIDHDEHNAGLSVPVEKIKDYLDAGPAKLNYNYN